MTASALGAPDLTLFNELYEEIENNPPALEARKLLVQQCYEVGWIDAARDALKELRVLDPSALEDEPWTKSLLVSTVEEPIPRKLKRVIPKTPSTPAELEAQKLELVKGYEELRLRAKNMLHESHLLRGLASSPTGNPTLNSRFSVHDQDLEALVNGRVSSVLRIQQPTSARTIARLMEASPEKAIDIAVTDLEDVARWLRAHGSSSTTGDNDAVREALVKRTQTLRTALPDAMKKHASTGLMHAEHEILKRKYVCQETMYGDPVSDIPRANFLVSEDGYPCMTLFPY